ncbi:DUF6603 domain-containing protein [Streptomyces sp. NPDC088794]|uniref:DUF6603 domain-containing protein n=1 Tax=Streptomyces sp. NPDC088794 TaxID=3365902 RepID=UPI003827B866
MASTRSSARPPLPFPSPKRLALSLLDESYARVRIETYFAVTTNSVQLGARAEAYFGMSALSVEGYFSLDALLRFSPFYLIVEISTGFSVKVFGMGVFGVQLRGSLEGPTPWHISGSASIEFFFSISFDVDETFGERKAETLPPLPVLPALRAELEKLDTWKAALPAGARLLVTLRKLDEPDLLVLHPVGVLQVSQRFVPLNLPIDKVGNQTPSDITKATVTVDAGSVVAVRGPTRERFAVAQYRTMDDAAKLAAPAYELLESGVELAAAGNTWATGPTSTRTVRYEQVVIDSEFERHPTHYFGFWGELFVHFIAGATIASSELSLAAERRRQPFAEKVGVTGDQYVVASQVDNTAMPGGLAFASHAEAMAHLASAVAAEPNLGQSVHVIPMAEVNLAE